MSAYPGGGALGNFFDSVIINGTATPHGTCAMSLGQHVDGRDYTIGFTYDEIDPGRTGAKMWHAMQTEELQIMMDALWSAGVRPKVLNPIETTGSEGFNAGKVAAMQDHLADMRRLVFGQPQVEEISSPDIPLTRSIE